MELWIYVLTVGFFVLSVAVEVFYPISGAAKWSIVASVRLFGYIIFLWSLKT